MQKTKSILLLLKFREELFAYHGIRVIVYINREAGMNWLKRNWLWVLVNIFAIQTIIMIVLSFNVDFSGSGVPVVSVNETVVREGLSMHHQHSPLERFIHITGESAIQWLIFSLCCTPIFILTGWGSVSRLKKAMGLYAFLFAILHLVFFLADRGLMVLFDEFNFVLGLMAVAIMLPLATTSNKWSMKRLKKNWKLLHRAAYAAGACAVLHLIFLERADWAIYAVLLVTGFVIRIPQVKTAIIDLRHHYLSPARASVG